MSIKSMKARFGRIHRYPLILLIFSLLLINLPLHDLYAQRSPSDEIPMYVDEEGVMRWSSNNEEVALFGVNYSAPFAHGYRAINYVGADHERTIDRDVYHLARMGVDAYRIHVWDIEISDRQGNLLKNDHLRLLDYLIMRLKERGIKIVLTLMRNDDNSYPEADEDVLDWGFSRDYPEEIAHHTPEAVEIQQRYARQFVTHENQYTGLSYKDDPDILAFEINNEPPHNNNTEEVRNYVTTMVEAMRDTGLKKPIFYNMSHNFGVKDAFLTDSIQGGTFQWYPTGLNAGFTQKGNFLPNVDSYPIPFSGRPGFQDKGLLVYEFSSADVTDNYLYPAMARTFRETGFQFMTQFAYDPLPIAYENSEYKTHHLNLAYTPSKAISFKIASEVAHRLPRKKSYGKYPENTEFGPFRLSYEQNLAEMVTDQAFYYSNDTESKPRNPQNLQNLAGVGSSPLVEYEGTGAYFLDKLEDGVWRLEVMPDAVLVNDPFDDPNIDKTVSRVVWNRWPIDISLPDLGSGYSFRGINGGNNLKGAADGQTITVRPGVYILSRNGVSAVDWSGEESFGNIRVGEFVAPSTDGGDRYNVLHTPVREATADQPLEIRAQIVGPDIPDKVELFYSTNTVGALRPSPTMHSYNPRRMEMDRVDGYTYEATIPDSLTSGGGGIMYYVVLKNGNDYTTWPGEFDGKPGDWDYYNNEYWGSSFVEADTPLALLNPEEDFNHILALQNEWGVFAEKRLVHGSGVGNRAIRVTIDMENDDLLFLREYVGDQLKGRTDDLRNFSDVVVRARSLNDQTKTLQFGLLTTDGYTYASPFELTRDWKNIRIPLSRLEQTNTALRLAYPQMLDDFFIPETDIPFDAAKIENWEISTANTFESGSLAYEVENIWLE